MIPASMVADGDSVGRRLRVVYVWDADYPWDVRTEKICAALTAAGHDVHIVARNKTWQSTVELLAEGTVHRMAPWRGLGRRVDTALSFPAFFSPRWRQLLDRVVRVVNADVLIVRDLPLCPLALSVGRRRRVPVVLDMAENYAAMMQQIWDAGRQRWFDAAVRNPRLVARIERTCLRRVDRVLTVVDESSERIVGPELDAARVSVVSNTPLRARAESVPAAAPSVPSDAPLHLVYLGLMEIPRGVSELVDAVGLLRAEGRAVRLTLIGGGRDEQLFRERVERLGLRDAVDFRGYVQNHDALRIVAGADVGIVPHYADESWNTTIPNKLFDYMAAGLPVVSSDAAPCARILRETGAGEVFRSGDAAALARAVSRFFDADARRECGAAGRRAVKERYNWEASTRVLLRAVADAAASPLRDGRPRRTS